MIVFLLSAYFLTFFCVIQIRKGKHPKYTDFPHLNLNSKGICFVSNQTHRIIINTAKTMLINKNLYIKYSSQLVIISNVENIKIYDKYLYFDCLGKVEILFNTKDYYKHFAIIISSNQFDLNKQKQIAILDLINNEFDINQSPLTKRYINIIKNILNIVIDKEKVIVKPNKFKFSYVLTYKSNNKIKRITINEKI